MTKLKFFLIIICISLSTSLLGQIDPKLVMIKWCLIEKGRINSGDPYFHIIDEDSKLKKFPISKEHLENGESTIFIHKKLKEYYKLGYEIISSNLSVTSMGYCEKGEYILMKK